MSVTITDNDTPDDPANVPPTEDDTPEPAKSAWTDFLEFLETNLTPLVVVIASILGAIASIFTIYNYWLARKRRLEQAEKK